MREGEAREGRECEREGKVEAGKKTERHTRLPNRNGCGDLVFRRNGKLLGLSRQTKERDEVSAKKVGQDRQQPELVGISPREGSAVDGFQASSSQPAVRSPDRQRKKCKNDRICMNPAHLDLFVRKRHTTKAGLHLSAAWERTN